MKDYIHLFGGMLLAIVLLAAYIFFWGYIGRCFADEPATNAAPIVAETLFEDGTTNTWTAADLQQALGLMNRKYHREQETDHGRVTWHGKRMGQYLLDDGNGGQCLVQLYEDGFAWTNAATRVTLKDPEAAARRRPQRKRARRSGSARTSRPMSQPFCSAGVTPQTATPTTRTDGRIDE